MNKHLTTSYAHLILLGLQKKPMYEGLDGGPTRRRLTPDKLDTRRAKARRAKAARKAQR